MIADGVVSGTGSADAIACWFLMRRAGPVRKPAIAPRPFSQAFLVPSLRGTGTFCENEVGPVVRVVARGAVYCFAGGKSGLHRAACRLTAGGVRSKRILRKVPQKIYRREFGRKLALSVRVKRCGKSAPRAEQSAWQGKPHAEQDQIGEEERPAPFDFRVGC